MTRANRQQRRPRYPAPCAGCGRTARRLIRERHVTSEVDAAGRPAGARTERVFMVPYCASCTPKQ